MSLPPPPRSAVLEDFPSLVWRAHQPLARIHRHEFGSLFYGADQDGRWNPPVAGSDWGTCYVSTSPMGAALEVFGRLRTLRQRHLDERVLATIYVASDLRLADMTHPSIVGRYGLTAEASVGEAGGTYLRTQAWAERLRDAGFGGVYYAARHDPALGSRSIAIFGKATLAEGPLGPEAEFVEESSAATSPIPAYIVAELQETYGFTILGGGAAL